MPSTKTRINLTVPAEMVRNLLRLAKRHDRSLATVTLELLSRALEIEEDDALLAVAEERERRREALFSHARAWK